MRGEQREVMTEEFWAETEQGGRVQMQRWLTQQHEPTETQPDRWIDVTMAYRTADGDKCNRVDENTFTLFESGVKLTRVR